MAILFTWGRRAAARRAGGGLCRPAGGRRLRLLRVSGRPPAPRRQGGALKRAAAGAFPAPAFASPGWPHARPGGALRAPSPPYPPRGGGVRFARCRALSAPRGSCGAPPGAPSGDVRPPRGPGIAKGGGRARPIPPRPLALRRQGGASAFRHCGEFSKGRDWRGGHPEQSLLSLRVLAAA